MAEEKTNLKKIPWSAVVKRTSANQGIPEATISESFKAVEKEIGQMMIENQPKNAGDMTLIKTPLACFTMKNIAEHEEVDSKGDKYLCSQSIGLYAAVQTSWVELANTGFECTRKKIEK